MENFFSKFPQKEPSYLLSNEELNILKRWAIVKPEYVKAYSVINNMLTIHDDERNFEVYNG